MTFADSNQYKKSILYPKSNPTQINTNKPIYTFGNLIIYIK